MRMNRRALLGATAAGLALPALRSARAQDEWPSKPVRIIVPYAPGGGTDVTTRAIGEVLGEKLGQGFVIDNRAGANGVVGTEGVARSAPDGYTYVAATSTHVMNRHILPSLPYHPLNDFTPISLLARYPLVLMTGKGSPYNTLADLLKDAKAKKGQIAQGTSDAQSSFTANNFAKQAGVELVEVPYRGSGAYLADLTGGHLPVAWGSTATAMPLLAAGTVRVLGLSSPERSRFLPDVPTLGEQGVPGADFTGWFGLFAPAGLNPAIADRLNTAITEAFQTAVLKQRMDSLAVDPAPITRPDFVALLQREDRRWAAAARDNLLPRA
ncbi:tripartite tricarboxylate transporter substrate binding protein [Roseomonas sp. M0104]|uniref:Tripartite tricarboxylate transporter substrate binding protein n=1 Tax=Teichococcus coralli TaxID=2545983 RepID=A0A845BBK8_9PROT|nr:tripartite tricarboxylate transporter substrate-binding protein [Pseudoroseomonas coralli]MXP64973.1 tripartite tricarboxylate transporter substrate binding protein [Pseudoroseomonas coralli]